MMTKTTQERSRGFRMVLTAAFLAAGLFAASAPALAKDGNKHGHKNGHGNGHNNGQYSRGAKVGHYKVPQVMSREYRGWAQPYYTGRVYYAPHHHYHAAYRFPVWYGGVPVYRPYAYCGSNLFITGAVNLPQLALGFSFGSPGSYYVGGYYPAPPPVPYVVYEDHDHHHGCHHDHDDWED